MTSNMFDDFVYDLSAEKKLEPTGDVVYADMSDEVSVPAVVTCE